jgi:hypothetical protein
LFYCRSIQCFLFLIWIISVSMYKYHQSISFFYCQNSRSILFLDISIWHWLQLKMEVGFLLYVYTFCHVSARYFGAVHATIEQFINISLMHYFHLLWSFCFGGRRELSFNPCFQLMYFTNKWWRSERTHSYEHACIVVQWLKGRCMIIILYKKTDR